MTVFKIVPSKDYAVLMADLTCGKGSFFNFMPVEANCYGCELDAKAISCVPCTVGGILLWKADSSIMFLIAPALIGMGYGLGYSLQPLMLSAYFGDANFSVVFGVASTVANSGAAVGPVIVLTLSNILGGYGTAYLVLGILNAVCIFLALSIPVRKPENS